MTSTAPKTIRSRVINGIYCGSGSDVDLGQVSLINPATQTAADVWNMAEVQDPIQRGCTNLMVNRPYGAPLPTRVIRYTAGGSPVSSKFHGDARSMAAGLGLTFFEGWETTVGKLVSDYNQRVMWYRGRHFPIFSTQLTPWLWPNDINDSGFQDCPGKTLMRTLSYIRHQDAAFLDYGGAEVFADADGQAQSPVDGRYDTLYAIVDMLTAAGVHTHQDFTGEFANDWARVCGVEAMPPRSEASWMAGKAGMTWLALANGVNDAFDVRINNPAFLQPDEMDVMPIAQIQGFDGAAYELAMTILETYRRVRVNVKFDAMEGVVGGASMDDMLELGAVEVGDGGGGDGEEGGFDPGEALILADTRGRSRGRGRPCLPGVALGK